MCVEYKMLTKKKSSESECPPKIYGGRWTSGENFNEWILLLSIYSMNVRECPACVFKNGFESQLFTMKSQLLDVCVEI